MSLVPRFRQIAKPTPEGLSRTASAFTSSAALVTLGLAYQVGYWSEFSINLFSFAKPAELATVAIAPIFFRLILLLPTILWLVAFANLCIAGQSLVLVLFNRKSLGNDRKRRHSLMISAGLTAIAAVLTALSTSLTPTSLVPFSLVDPAFREDRFAVRQQLTTLLLGSLSVAALVFGVQTVIAGSRTILEASGILLRLRISVVPATICASLLTALLGKADAVASMSMLQELDTMYIVVLGRQFPLYAHTLGNPLCLTTPSAVGFKPGDGTTAVGKPNSNSATAGLLIRYIGTIGSYFFYFNSENGDVIAIEAKGTPRVSLNSCARVAVSHLLGKLTK